MADTAASETSAPAAGGLDFRALLNRVMRGDVALAVGILAILVMLLLPMVAVGVALGRGRLPRWTWAVFGLCWAIWAWRLPWWRAAWRSAAPLRPLIEESKLLLPVLLIGLGGWGAARSPDASVAPGGPLVR